MIGYITVIILMILTIILYKVNKSSSVCLSCHSCPNDNCDKRVVSLPKNNDIQSDPLKDEHYLKLKAHLDE